MADTPTEIPPEKTAVCSRCGETRLQSRFRETSIGNGVYHSDVCLLCAVKEDQDKLKAQQAEARERAQKRRQAAQRAATQKASAAARKAREAAAKERAKAGNLATAQAEKRKQEQVMKELASRELARRSLLHFTERNLPTYEAGWVHEDICRRLEQFVRDVEDRKSPRLMLALPPRAGKSELASVQFPAWLFGLHPEWEVISTSYSVDLPVGFSRRVRGYLQSSEYQNVFPDTQLSKDSTAAETWRTTKGGGFRAAGCGGGITGLGAHCVVPYSTIRTRDRGIIAASEVAIGDHVYGFDHESGRGVWTRVRAVSASLTDKPIIATNRVCTTEDHRIFTVEYGYVDASDITPGMSLLREKESAARGTMPDVLPEAARVPRFRSLRALWYRLRALCIGDCKSKTAARRRHQVVLLSQVPRRLQARASLTLQQGKRALRALWQVVSRQGQEEILFASLLSEPPYREPYANELYGAIPTPKSGYIGARQAYMPAVRETARAARGSSYRPRPRTQHVGQLSDSLQNLPQLVSHTPGVYADRLAPYLSGRGTYVVDLQTDTGNFFCAGVLVHNCLILDDVVKDEAEAESELARTRAWNWYGSTAYTRLAPGGGVLVIGTRWHDDDVSGRLEAQMEQGVKELEELEQERATLLVQSASAEVAVLEQQIETLRNSIDHWEIVKYPAIAQEDEYLDRYKGRIVRTSELLTERKEDSTEELQQRYRLLRKKGEALHPERFPLPMLLKYRRTMQPRHWSALYQQNPVPDEGLFFTREMFALRPHSPSRDELQYMRTFVAWDLAVSLKATADFTVGAVGALDADDNLWILDIVRGHWDTHGIVEQVLDTHERYGAYITGIEKTALELAIRPQLQRRMKERRTYITLAEGEGALKPVTDKLLRARPLQGRMQQGKVFVPQHAPWVETFVNELLRFPGGVRDDQVDAAAWLARLAEQVPLPTSRLESQRKQRFGGFASWRDRLKTLGSHRDEKNYMSR